MKFETATEWPDAWAEFKPIAEKATAGEIVKVDLSESDGEAPLDIKKAVDKLRNGLSKHGRFEVKSVDNLAFVRLATKPPRTRVKPVDPPKDLELAGTAPANLRPRRKAAA